MNERLLSVILLSYFSGDKLRTCRQELDAVLRQEGIPYELVIMDDGSTDGTFDVALELERAYGNVRAYQLSRNYTSHYSIFAGLSVCKGACAVPVPDDGQLPYDTVVAMYRLWERGHQVVLPHREERGDPFLSKWFAGTFYRIMNAISDVRFPKGGADSFLIDREVIDILNDRIRPINTATVTEILRLGFSPVFLPYRRPAGSNQRSRWSLKKKWKLMKDLVYSSSSFPIRLIINTGLLFFLVSVLLIVTFIVIKLFNLETGIYIFNAGVQGWTSLMTAVIFFGGLVLLSLGVIAEYVYRIYEEVKDRPGYIIRQKKEDHASR